MKETAADVWNELVEAAKNVSEGEIKLSDPEVDHYGSRLNEYIYLCSREETARGKAKWLTINETYKMDETFYKRTAKIIKDGRFTADSVSTEVLCYRISEIQKCLPEEVFDTLIKLKSLPPEAKFRQDIINGIRDVIIEKETTDSERMKEGVSNCQGGHDSLGNNVDDTESPEGIESDKYSVVQNGEAITFTDGLLEAEDMSPQDNGVDDGVELSAENDKCEIDSIEGDARLNILQHTDQDNTLEITKEDLERFVTDFIGAMSYEIKKRSPGERSSYYELLSLYKDEMTIFHQGIKTWEYVQVTYFANGMPDDAIEQEIERIYEMEERPEAFVIIACSTDRILRHVRKNVYCDRKNSIMLLCYERPDKAYIYLKMKPKSDKRCFEFSKPNSLKYFYY